VRREAKKPKKAEFSGDATEAVTLYASRFTVSKNFTGRIFPALRTGDWILPLFSYNP